MNKQDFLRELYTNPETGFLGKDRLYRKAKELNPKITKKDVDLFFATNSTSQLHQTVSKPTNMPILGNLGFYQADLIFYPRYKKQNRGYTGALIAININSRKGYGYPFKTKKAKEINKLLEEFIEDAEPLVIETDSGSEFLNKGAKQIYEKYGIVHNVGEVGNHRFLGKIDRFSRTIKSYISKYMTENDMTRWIDIFPKIINNYNNSYHSVIKMNPIDVDIEKEEDILNQTLENSLNKVSNKDLKVGDFVRVPLIKRQFQKEGQNYSNKVYEVVHVGINKVRLKDNDKTYNINQLLEDQKGSIEMETQNIKQADKKARVERKVKFQEGIEMNEEPKKYTKRKSKLKAYEKL